MTQHLLVVFLYWYNCASMFVRGHFEVIEGEEDRKISMDYESLQENDEIQVDRNKFLRERRHSKFPHDFRSAYPPSVSYILWLENNKRFPSWVYDTVRSKYHDDNIEWKINELSRLYRKCDVITGGLPLSGTYIRHLLELISLQKRIDDHSIIQDINTKQDLDYLKGVHLPKAGNSEIRLHLRGENEILKKVDPIGYLKALAIRFAPVRNILYRKYLKILHDKSPISEDKILKDIIKQSGHRSNRIQRRNTIKRKLIHKLINTTESESRPIMDANKYNPINKIENVIDLIEDPGLNISTSLRKELRQVCKEYLNNYLGETYNLTNILQQYLGINELTDESKYKKFLDSDLDQTLETITIGDKENIKKETDSFFLDVEDYKNKTEKKQGNTVSKTALINKNINEIIMKNITAGDTMYSKIKVKSNAEDGKKKRQKFKLTRFIENTKIYKKIKKLFSDNYLLSKYDLIDVLQNIGYDLSKQSKKDLTCLYGELLKTKQKAKLKELFDEQSFSLCFPNMKYEAVIDMLTSLMLCNINIRRQKNKPKLAEVLENLGFNMTRSTKNSINKLYFARTKSNSNISK